MSFDLSLSLLILRLGLGITFFLHGSRHFLGWFGGRGFKDTITNWRDRQNIPAPIGVIGVFTEFFGGIALILGLLTRPAALGLAIFMAMAIYKSHWGHGFFLARREGDGNGFEYCMALMFMALALLFGGSGAISVDWLLS